LVGRFMHGGLISSSNANSITRVVLVVLVMHTIAQLLNRFMQISMNIYQVSHFLFIFHLLYLLKHLTKQDHRPYTTP
jgi:hypothetical protein